jgi:hypothetical protein
MPILAREIVNQEGNTNGDAGGAHQDAKSRLGKAMQSAETPQLCSATRSRKKIKRLCLSGKQSTNSRTLCLPSMSFTSGVIKPHAMAGWHHIADNA